MTALLEATLRKPPILPHHILPHDALAVVTSLPGQITNHALSPGVLAFPKFLPEIKFPITYGHGLGVFLIAITAATLDPRGIRVAWYLLANALGAGLLADVVKVAIGRCRPSQCASLDIPVLDTFIGWFPAATYANYENWFDSRFASFPSAHAATAAGLAVGLSMLYPRGRWLFAFFALLAGLQRCYSQAHFVSDVWVGYGVGLVWSCIVWRVWPRGYPVPSSS